MRQISNTIWTANTDVRLSPGVYFDTRMTVVDTGGGELLIYSPIPIDGETAAEIRALGDVRWIIAPNNFHHMFLEKAAKIFPEASVWGASRAIKQHPDVNFDGCLADGRPTDLPDSVALLNIAGTPALQETVLWLPDDSAVVCADLVFNMNEPKTFMTRLVLGMVTSRSGEPEQSRSFRWFFVKDRGAYAETLGDLVSRPFDTLVMSHGEPVSDGSTALRKAVEWALPKQQARLAHE